MSKNKALELSTKFEEIEIEVGEVIGSFEAIVQLSQTRGLKISTNYKLSKAYKEIRKIIRDFEDFKDSLRSEFATKKTDEKGQMGFDFGDKEADVRNRLKEEMKKTVTLSLPSISIKDLEGADVQASILADLSFLITE